MTRTLILLYGVLSYLIGVIGIVCLIGALAQLIPYGFLWNGGEIAINPIIWNLILVGIWGIIHSIMARAKFKAAITRLIPKSAERATYVLVAGVTSVAMIGF